MTHEVEGGTPEQVMTRMTQEVRGNSGVKKRWAPEKL